MAKFLSRLASFAVLFFLTFLSAGVVYGAVTPAFVTVVNPVRGDEFWSLSNQKPKDAVLGESKILSEFSVPATWLIRFDALDDQEIVNNLRNDPKLWENGLLLEITPSLAQASGVTYHQTTTWHSAGSVFLTGYTQQDRQKLIDTSFARFKKVFGNYPKSVGAWWIDSYSLEYMQKNYGITSSLEVADQYTTDNYQIWGQYWGTPYYPAKNNALIPAQDLQYKLPIVLFQWAARDPVNGYGNGVEESTYSPQANDYIDYHHLDINYFSKLVDIYTNQSLNKFNQITVGLENSYNWEKYRNEYQNQIKVLSDKNKSGQLSLSRMIDFSDWYMRTFPELSPSQIIVADDPLGSDKKTVWFMNNFYRAGWFYDQNGSNFRDIRQYINGSQELCLDKACDSLNFATSATRVLDDVSFNQNWPIDEGKISKFSVTQNNDSFEISYLNQASKQRNLEFLPRDLSVDGKISTIDGAILDATKKAAHLGSIYPTSSNWQFKGSLPELLFELIKFTIFFYLFILVPGKVFLYKMDIDQKEGLLGLFLSSSIGISLFVLLSYFLGYFKVWWLTIPYALFFLVIFVRKKIFKIIHADKVVMLIILAGTIFQLIPTLKSGLLFDYGLGFWGSNGHDSLWHITLINELIKAVPPQNPIFAGVAVKNYHYFYDLLVAQAARLTLIPVTDLIFRFFPLTFSFLLGFGTYVLSLKIFRSKLAGIFSLYFVYFAGSFGWIVTFLKERSLGGESAFWANQSISFNLNPPFAISLILLFGLIYLISLYNTQRNNFLVALIIIILGSLIEFKSYAGLLAFGSVFTVAIFGLYKKDYDFIKIFLFSSLLSLVIFIPNITNQQFFVLSPLWLVHTMMDAPDRVGWLRIANARVAYFARGEWPKFIFVEALATAIFILGNLGMRIIGAFSFKKVVSPGQHAKIFLISLVILSALIPLLFIQVGNSWNVIQFFYYFMYILSIFAGGSLALLTGNRSKRRTLVMLVLCLILVITPINSLVSIRDYLGNTPPTFLSKGEMEGLDYLSKQPEGVILTYPFDQRISSLLNQPKPLFAYGSTAYVSAFSKKEVYIEDEVQNDILQTDYLKRLVEVKDFFNSNNYPDKRNFLKGTRIKYLYLPKYYNISFDEGELGVRKIFDNNEVGIYERNE